MAQKIIAFAGKGGVGKTSLAALTVKALVEYYPNKKILAIDADPAVGLSTALGVSVLKTVDSVRISFVDRFTGPDKSSAQDALNDAHFLLTDAVVDAGDFAFLAIGRPESAGCYCAVNDFLKIIITELAEEFDYVVIDGEAGIEQINRRVMEKVTDLILVSDASKKGIGVITEIRNVARSLGMYSKCGAVINRVKTPEAERLIDLGDIRLLGFIGDDDDLTMADVKGESLFEIGDDLKTYAALKKALEEMEVLK